MSRCEATEDQHHSDDLIEVYQGRVEPTLLCGFHAQKRGLQP